jgi:hypothetical protein
MNTPRQKLLLSALVSALGISAMLTSSASAQSYHERASRSPHQRLYNYAPRPSAQQPNSDIPYYGNAPYDQRDDW